MIAELANGTTILRATAEVQATWEGAHWGEVEKGCIDHHAQTKNLQEYEIFR
jgi:hypothetical protein